MTRIDLDVVGTHADGAGGLEFLGSAHSSFGIFCVAFSSVVCADAAFQIVYEGAKVQAFEISLAALVIVTEVILLGPLLVYMPLLMRKSPE